jgi:hypothetical protein
VTIASAARRGIRSDEGTEAGALAHDRYRMSIVFRLDGDTPRFVQTVRAA